MNLQHDGRPPRVDRLAHSPQHEVLSAFNVNFADADALLWHRHHDRIHRCTSHSYHPAQAAIGGAYDGADSVVVREFIGPKSRLAFPVRCRERYMRDSPKKLWVKPNRKVEHFPDRRGRLECDYARHSMRCREQAVVADVRANVQE